MRFLNVDVQQTQQRDLKNKTSGCTVKICTVIHNKTSPALHASLWKWNLGLSMMLMIKMTPVFSLTQVIMNFLISLELSFQLSVQYRSDLLFPGLRQMEAHLRPHTHTMRITEWRDWALHQSCLSTPVSRFDV